MILPLVASVFHRIVRILQIKLKKKAIKTANKV